MINAEILVTKLDMEYVETYYKELVLRNCLLKIEICRFNIFTKCVIMKFVLKFIVV